MRGALRTASLPLLLWLGACGGTHSRRPTRVAEAGAGHAASGERFVWRSHAVRDSGSEHYSGRSAGAAHGAEPRIEEVLAWAAAHGQQGLDELDSISNRARLRGLLPSVNLSARHGRGVDLTQQSLANDLRVGNDEDLTLYAALTFDLPRLVFAREEVSIARQRAQRRAAITALQEQVIALFFERRRLLQEAHQLSSARAEQVRLQLRIEEVTARLDVFTGGIFSRMIKASSTAVMGEPNGNVAPEESRRVPAEDAPGDHDRQPP